MRADRRVVRIAVAVAIVGVTACSSSSSAPSVSSVSGVDADVEAPAGHSARGRVVDLAGAPVTNIYVTVSKDYCVPDRTTASGTFDVRNVSAGGLKRLILYGPTANGGPHASLAFAFQGDDDSDVDFAAPIVTPRLAGPLSYRADLTTPQRLATADGFAITLRAADLHLESLNGTSLYAMAIPLDKAPPFGDVVKRLHALYVLEPLQSTLATPAAIELPNPRGLAAGTSVDIFQLDYASGALVVRAKGHVRGDGIVASDDGQGITELTWIGFAPSTS